MGYRAHVRTKSIVEYDYNQAYFNHLSEKLAEFLRNVCPSSCLYDSCDCLKDNWEIYTSELKEEIEVLKNAYEPDEEVFMLYTAQELIDIFQKWVDAVEKNPENHSYPEWINIDWF